MLVFGCRPAAALLMKRPVIAERLPRAPLGTVCVTVVFGLRAAVRPETKRPVRALREMRAMFFTSFLLSSRPGHADL